MKKAEAGLHKCVVCGKPFAKRDLVHADSIRPQITTEISKACPAWTSDSIICQADLAQFRMAYVRSMLESEKGELSSLEQEVLNSIHNQELITENIDKEFEQDWSLGERLADRIATFGGSWLFLICFGLVLATWVVINSTLLILKPFDPYPFILLNLILSCLAAIQAPIIMMSQNRQEAKDRLRSQYDYKVNLKAELEIRHLHEKLDHLLLHQWDRLVQIQEIQLELLTDLGRKK